MREGGGEIQRMRGKRDKEGERKKRYRGRREKEIKRMRGKKE